MDEFYMRQALHIAKNALGRTSPNPMVGAVVVKNGEIVGYGWHKRAGTPHAEIHALKQAGEAAAGATLYVTLEPCCHHGRTGPCTEAVIHAGIKKVVVAMTDPNPLVAGCGLTQLRKAGIEVIEGILAKEAAQLNEVFIKWISTEMPFTVLKTAMTLDGKIATSTGDSKWITGPAARQHGHQLRSQYDGILVGIGTVLADNPSLTARIPNGKNPIRIIVDTMARTPVTAKVVADQLAPTIIAVSSLAPRERVAALKNQGIEILTVPPNDFGLDLHSLFLKLGGKKITSILIEGGARINASALEANIVDKIYCFIAPKLLGGMNAPGPLGGQGIAKLSDALLLENSKTDYVGDDILISAYLRRREGRDVYRTCGRIG